MQCEGLRFTFRFLRNIGQGDGFFRFRQIAVRQILLCGIVGYIICKGGVLQVLHIGVYPVRIQGPAVGIPEVQVVIVKARALLVPGEAVSAGKGDVLHGAEGGNFILQNEPRQIRVKFLHRVMAEKVDISIAQGGVALGIHLAEVPQSQLCGLLPSGQADSALGLFQAVLAQVLRLLDGEGSPQGGKLGKKVIHFLRVYGEGGVCIIDPGAVLLAKGIAYVVIIPAHGVDILHFQNGGRGIFDFFLVLLLLHDPQGHGADNYQQPQQKQQLFLTLHFCILLLSKTVATPMAR